jgi:hypothetical protein
MDDLYIPDSSSEEFPRKGTPLVLSEATEAPAATDDIPSAESKLTFYLMIFQIYI